MLFTRENTRILLILTLLAGMLIGGVNALKNPSVSLLPPKLAGEWIRPNYAVEIHARKKPLTAAIFRKRFVVKEPQINNHLAVTAFRELRAVSLDGIKLDYSPPRSWKDEVDIVLPDRLLRPGMHELQIAVVNSMAPPLVNVSSSMHDLWTGRGWEALDYEETEWKPVLCADEQRFPAVRAMFPSVSDGVRALFPIFVPLIFVVYILAIYKPKLICRITQPGVVKFLLMAAIIVLAGNNIHKLGPDINDLGFDTREHLEYISYMLENHRLPLASEGWQMFQPPLYYVVSLTLLLLSRLFMLPGNAYFLLSLFSFGCLLLIVEITYRLLREIFPGNGKLQSCGLLVGALLPMNLYMSHFVGNEPLSAVLTALLILLTVKLLKADTIRTRDMIIPGMVTGLAILSKITPLILIPVVCFFIANAKSVEKSASLSRVKNLGIYISTTLLACGWFFARNWIYLGKPLFTGWDSSRKIIWWQDPGYRILKDYWSFGEALNRPAYAAFNGFADGFYSTFWGDGYNACEYLVTVPEPPHWNHLFLAGGMAFSLVPALLMATGIVYIFRRSAIKEEWPSVFLLASMGVYFAALLHLYTTLPIFSTVKASYTMGLTPCYAVMAAYGSSLIIGKKYVGPLLVALLVTWGIITYTGFFIT